MELSRLDVIAFAACHECCAFRGEPCTFNRTEDPDGARTAAKQSHLTRTEKARAMFDLDDLKL